MVSRIRLKQLEAYRSIVLTGGVTSAAEALNLSQPAVSRLLFNLEAEIGFKLFKRRSGGRMEQTEEGVDFYRQIDSLLDAIAGLGDIANDVREHRRLRLSIVATPPLLTGTLIPEALVEFRKKYPKIRYSITQRDRVGIEEWVQNRKVDVGVTLLPVEHRDIIARMIARVAPVLVVPRSHPMAERDCVEAAELQNETKIIVRRQPLRNQINRLVELAGGKRGVAIEASAAIICCQMVAHGHGVTICDPFSAAPFLDRVKMVRLKPFTVLEYGCLYSPTRQPTEIIKSFETSLKRTASNFLERHPAAQPE
ncbi:LysR family transcriptional regulator [Oceaniglobus trochenteri]|uniref:LysR family transcriptional regulator n=1 Tax=Oceaniglobus trochenteri TaxID=2763260 RepID=UPI001D000916|nr:LysR family transcriptional regulator [Oceaniglobus trochenteri]